MKAQYEVLEKENRLNIEALGIKATFRIDPLYAEPFNVYFSPGQYRPDQNEGGNGKNGFGSANRQGSFNSNSGYQY